MNQGPRQQLNIELKEPEAEGIYANLAMLTHSPNEIVIDFARVVPGSPKARILSRIIMTPMNARLLQRALDDNLKKFEAQFGEIKVHGQSQSKPIGFQTPDATTPE